MSENRSADIAEEALSTGASGYVAKSEAASELPRAVNAVLEGKRFVSASLSGHNLTGPPDPQTDARFQRDNVVTLMPPQSVGGARHHEVGFYSDDRQFLDNVTGFIGAALGAGNAAIVAATEAHRDGLLSRLQGQGADIADAIEQGRYISVDVANAVSTIDGMLDPVRYLNLFGNLIVKAADAAKGQRARVALFGEGVHLLWAQGNAEAAFQVERLCNQLAKAYDVDILCGYSLHSVPGGMESPIYEKICAEHSAVYSR